MIISADIVALTTSAECFFSCLIQYVLPRNPQTPNLQPPEISTCQTSTPYRSKEVFTRKA